jgi:hypothetical protein
MNGLGLSTCLSRDEPVRDPDARDDLQALGVSRHLEAGRVPAEHCDVRLAHRTAGLLGAPLDHLQDITEAQVGRMRVRIGSATRIRHRSAASLIVSRVLGADLPAPTVHRGFGARRRFGEDQSEARDIDEPDIDALDAMYPCRTSRLDDSSHSVHSRSAIEPATHPCSSIPNSRNKASSSCALRAFSFRASAAASARCWTV